MKEIKGIQIILLIIVVLLWSFVIYKFVFKSTYEEKDIEINPISSIPEKDKTKNNLFNELNFEFSDPFVSHLLRSKQSKKDKIEVQEKKVEPLSNDKKEKVVWPELFYFGLIKKSKGVEFGLITIDGKMLILSVGKNFEGVKVIGLKNDSMMIEFQGTTKTILKK